MNKEFYSMGFMNYCSHDPGVSLVKASNNDIEHISIEEGVLSRKKKSYQFPIRSIEYCLNYFNITIDDIDIFVFDYMDHKRVYRTSDNYRLLIGDFIRFNLKIDLEKIIFIDSHHLAHAYTAFYPSKFKESLVIVVDGLGSEQQTHSVFKANIEIGIECLFEQKGTGIGTLYTLVTRLLGFDSGEEGKVMGLAPYGNHEQPNPELHEIFKGDFNGLLTDYSQQMRRNPSPEILLNIKPCTNKDEIYDDYYTQVAYEVQKETERCLLHIIKNACDITGIHNVCLAGGVALNCVTNNLLQHADFIDNLFVQPASGDSGIPFGLALYGMKQIYPEWNEVINLENVRKKFSSPYSTDINPMEGLVLSSFNNILEKHHINPRKFISEEIAFNLSKGKIVSFFQQGIEYGPRALGHRSFLADPRSEGMKEKMNRKIKHREAYRPFAPMILKEYFNDYFDSIVDNHPYMLQAPQCKQITKKEAPSIVHVDNTARVQTVTDSNGRIHEVLKDFHRITGTPILINTSFNDNNEPIVLNLLDALCCFSRTNADILVYNDMYISRDEIKNILEFTVDCEKSQKHIADKFFIKAIKNNTVLSDSYNANRFVDFMRHNLTVTNYNQNERMQQKLISFIISRNVDKRLILDKYHYELLTSVFNDLVPGNIEIYFPIYRIVEDDHTFLDNIEDDSDILLYNCSLYFWSKYPLQSIKELNNVYCFYLLMDKLVKPLRLNDMENSNSGVVDFIMKTYENTQDATIYDFFKKINE